MNNSSVSALWVVGQVVIWPLACLAVGVMYRATLPRVDHLLARFSRWREQRTQRLR